MNESAGLWDLLKHGDLPFWERLDIWLNSGHVALGISLTTYYIICSAWGFLTGYGMGNMIVQALR